MLRPVDLGAGIFYPAGGQDPVDRVRHHEAEAGRTGAEGHFGRAPVGDEVSAFAPQGPVLVACDDVEGQDS